MNEMVVRSSRARREIVAQIAPRYREASLARKRVMLDSLVEMTGYARKYAIALLHQETPPGPPTIRRPRPSRYGSEVQQALFVAWKAASYICAKRLIPFLPKLLPYLERKGRLQLNEEQRRQLLAMSSATAERLLRTQRKPAPRGLSTTKAGTLLKHQIPVRTFAGWEDARPGFLEADLVAHCGGHTQGSYLYTLTLTDVATGWTECLPLLARTSDLVLDALEHARRLFPFPILGIDSDNGAEFINADLVAYCEREQVTFTRGRPEVKNDQCYIEQKNGAVVRHFVGHDRLVGEEASQQLGELYRALRLYVNCFQPCMKLLSKHQEEGKRVRRIYDEAKTPLQRLLLSGVLSASAKLELEEAAQALDPLDLAEQVEQLQQAVWRHAVPTASSASPLRFAVEQCLSEPRFVPTAEPDPAALARETPTEQKSFLNWRRSSTNPFASEWERILAWVRTHPDGSTRELFEELQRQFPGHYHLSQYSALQRGVRKMRAYLRDGMGEDPWPIEMIHGPLETTGVAAPMEAKVPQRLSCVPALSLTERGRADSRETRVETENHRAQGPGMVQDQARSTIPSASCEKETDAISAPAMTIDVAIQVFLEEVKAGKRRDKTLGWHQRALRSLQEYLMQRDKCLLQEITPAVVRDWLAQVCATPAETGDLRSASTIHSAARSVRVFCNWLVSQGYLERTPFVKGTIPQVSYHPIQVVEPDVFERLVHACGPYGEVADHATVRNRTLLWLLLETGLLLSEVCALRLGDLDRDTALLTITGNTGKARQVPLGEKTCCLLQEYLDRFRLTRGEPLPGEAFLFLSERRDPLTPNTITLLLRRLSRRIGLTGQGITASQLRDTFAVRSLQQGVYPHTLQKLLGLSGTAVLKRYQEAARPLSDQAPARSIPKNRLS